MPVLRNIGQLATCRGEGPQGDIHPVGQAAVAWRGDTIAWVGPEAELPDEWAGEPGLDARGGLVVPGLVDCHTHLAFGGWRAGEFERRILGVPYLEIARQGGGIASTVRATREASTEELRTKARAHLDQMLALGVSTVECKSGYGLSLEHELRLLRLYAALAAEGPQRVVATLLGAHVVPRDWEGPREGYLAMLEHELIPTAAAEGLARFNDVFVEDTAFTVEEAGRLFRAGLAHGLRPKLHADQLSDGGGAALAAQVGAASADHLEHASDTGIAAMAAAGVVAVSLPLATLYLGQAPMPARAFLEAGVPVAVATDFNPGSAPSWHLPLAMMLACTMQRMTPAEVVKGATLVAARAVGMDDRIGSVEPGKLADLAVIDAPDVDHWMYQFRPNACRQTIIGGTVRWESA